MTFDGLLMQTTGKNSYGLTWLLTESSENGPLVDNVLSWCEVGVERLENFIELLPVGGISEYQLVVINSISYGAQGVEQRGDLAFVGLRGEFGCGAETGEAGFPLGPQLWSSEIKVGWRGEFGHFRIQTLLTPCVVSDYNNYEGFSFRLLFRTTKQELRRMRKMIECHTVRWKLFDLRTVSGKDEL